MFRIVLRFWRGLNPEIAIGFLIATVFWIGILGWQAAYAPTEVEKQKCYEAAQHGDHKTEECKSLWEKATTDPVAFFTLWLVIFTGGLTISTVMLWIAGERQIELAREASAAQSRDMRASIEAAEKAANAAVLAANSERAWLAPSGFDTATALNPTVDGVRYPIAICFSLKWLNNGRSPAIGLSLGISGMTSARNSPAPHFQLPDGPEDQRGILGPGMGVSTGMQAIAGDDLERFKRREVDWMVYSRVTYYTVSEPGVMRYSEICARVEYDGENVGPNGERNHRLSMSPIGPQNGAS